MELEGKREVWHPKSEKMDQEKNVVASLALHAVLEPVFTEVRVRYVMKGVCFNCLYLYLKLEAEDKNIAAVQTLRAAFNKVNSVGVVVSIRFMCPSHRQNVLTLG